MSSGPSVSERHASDASAENPAPSLPKQPKPQRVLACVLCQQRKIKCDRKFPCANCIKSRAQCIPATLGPRRRRRRFPERDLLDRLRRYEELLRQNKIPFEPLHKDSVMEKDSLNAESGDESNDEHHGAEVSSPSTTVKSERGGMKNVWRAMNLAFRDPDNESDSSNDDIREIVVKKAWDQANESNDYLFFGARKTPADLSAIHPDPIQIFRIWQVYVDNVNPLLKVTHIPTLQARIIEAVGNLATIDPVLEALLFGIYCTAMLSLSIEDCRSMFDATREDLLTKYQFGCQQALLNCNFLRTEDRDCLTALYLYLISFRPSTVPHSLSPLLGVAIRIAYRMGIHKESALAKCSILEAEMRRRLWWSLVIFDTRIGELSNCETGTLDPTWECNVPLNVNDSDLRPDMKGQPAVQGRTSEAIFAVVRSEVGEFIRHSVFHLDFTKPILKPIAKSLRGDSAPEGSELEKLEQVIEDRYLRFCDQENPIHYMTMWSTRTFLAKCRLLEFQATQPTTPLRWTETQLDTATSFALKILDCDTRIINSPLTKGFLWLHNIYFPFPAYMQLIQDLKKRPLSSQAQRAWAVMSENYEAWYNIRLYRESQLFNIFAQIVLIAWKSYEEACEEPAGNLQPPGIVLSIKRALLERAQQAETSGTEHVTGDMDMGFDDFPMPMSMNFANPGPSYNMGMQSDFTTSGSEFYQEIPAPSPFSLHMNQMNWSMFQGRPGWNGFST